MRPYFSKYGHSVSRKHRNHDVNECKFVVRKADRRTLMGSYHSLTFVYFKSFPGLKYTAGPDRSTSVSLTFVYFKSFPGLKYTAGPDRSTSVSLTFVYFKSFPGLKYTAGPDWSTSVLNR